MDAQDGVRGTRPEGGAIRLFFAKKGAKIATKVGGRLARAGEQTRLVRRSDGRPARGCRKNRSVRAGGRQIHGMHRRPPFVFVIPAARPPRSLH